MKPNSPIFIASIISLINAFILSILVYFLVGKLLDITGYFIVFCVSFIASLIALYFFIESFFNKKIKLVYKNIHNSKITKSNDVKIKMNEDIFEKVNTEVKKWEQERNEEIGKLVEQENFRKEFVGNVSHELKTPIFNIQGYILTLLEGGIYDSKINMEYLKRAEKSVERMISIVKDLDDITMYEANKLIPEFKSFDIVKLVQDVQLSLELKAHEAEISIRFRENYNYPIKVSADKKKIRQVIVNLFINGIKYGKKGGYIEVRFYEMGENILVEVADNGVGIEEKHLPRLFERFYRVESSRSRDKGGSGLGLAIVKHIIDSHNQTINVRSTPNVGTTFSFTLQKSK